jgi:hypothetical protein
MAGITSYWNNDWKDDMYEYNKTKWTGSKLRCKEASSINEVGTTVCRDCCAVGIDDGCSECDAVYCSADGRCSVDGQTFSELNDFDATIFSKYKYSIPDTDCDSLLNIPCRKYRTTCEAQPDNTGASGGEVKLVNKGGFYELECHMPGLNSLDGCLPSSDGATKSDSPSLTNLHILAIQHINPTFQSENVWESKGFYDGGNGGFCFSTTLKTAKQAELVFGEFGEKMNSDYNNGFMYGQWIPDMRNNNGIFKVAHDSYGDGGNGGTTTPTNCDGLKALNGGHDFQWYPGRTYNGGRWSTKEECNTGTCSIGEAYKFDHTLKRFRLTTAAECAARASCDGIKYGSCPKCFEKGVVDRDEKQLCFGKPTGSRLAVTRKMATGVGEKAGGVAYPFVNDTAKTPIITCPEGSAIKAVAVKAGNTGYSLKSAEDFAAPSSNYSGMLGRKPHSRCAGVRCQRRRLHVERFVQGRSRRSVQHSLHTPYSPYTPSDSPRCWRIWRVGRRRACCSAARRPVGLSM